MYKSLLLICFLPTIVLANEPTSYEEIVVSDSGVKKIGLDSVTRVIDGGELQQINMINVEDALSYQPNLIVRKRYIGDINSTLGMRGSNMYQTTRSMVFADGLPLHYFLQTQFSGAPRWSLVAPEEIESIDVTYGPFSAEYSGNAMGGVININTQKPKKQALNIKLSGYSQDSNTPRDDASHPGYQTMLSYENQYEGIGVYIAYSHLENESQSLTFSRSDIDLSVIGESVSGASIGRDNVGGPVVYYGDQGPEKTVSDLVKLKLYFGVADFKSQFSLAYENRKRTQESPKSYVRDNLGNIIWSGQVNQNGLSFTVDPEEFYLRDQNRESLLAGLNASGPLFHSEWQLKLNLSRFEILKDEDLESLGTFEDADFDGSATVTDLSGSAWNTMDLQLQREMNFAGREMQITTGLYHDRYYFKSQAYGSLFPSADSLSELQGAEGETSTNAAFVHSRWDLTDRVDLGLGLRVEQWKSKDKLPLAADASDHREDTQASPKFSLSYQISSLWDVEYAFAKAYRFPIVEELFQNERRTSGTILSNANLQPEKGRHHNLHLQRKSKNATAGVTLFYEEVQDVIFNQTQISPRVRTFLPVDEVETLGLELSYQNQQINNLPLSISINSSYTHTEIIKNTANPETEGNDFPRMPKWRVNAIGAYQINESLLFSTGIQYQSNSYGRIDNTDREEEVFGAHDDFMFVNLKLDYKLNNNIKISIGVDNVTNDLAYVFSPWPGRTFFSDVQISL